MKILTREENIAVGNGTLANLNEKISYYNACQIDDSADLLNKSYALRYQVYCEERGFLRGENYPDKLESDTFDDYALHFGVFDTDYNLAATARLVRKSVIGLPLCQHCTLFAGESELFGTNYQIVEVSRLAVSKVYRRRRGDGYYGHDEPTIPYKGIDRRTGENAVFALYKSIYQLSKRSGITHWVAATEKSLHRLLTRHGFPFRPIGPEIDYFGPVMPYVLTLEELDEVILGYRMPHLKTFLIGLEPEFQPHPANNR